MPAKSKSQQRLFGMVHAYQKGKLKHAPASVKRIAKHVSEEDAKHFAETKHDGLPEKKDGKMKKSAAYEAGFMLKCASFGIPREKAEELYKQANAIKSLVRIYRVLTGMQRGRAIDVGKRLMNSAIRSNDLAKAQKAVHFKDIANKLPRGLIPVG